MNIRVQHSNSGKEAFTLVEVVIGMAILMAVALSLYAGIATGFNIIRASREKLRATQVLLEKFEAIRLFTWDQLWDTNHYNATDIDYYNVKDREGVQYRYNVTVTSVPAAAGLTYSSDLALVKMSVVWTSAGLTRSNSMYSYVARQGLQQYVY